MALTDKIYAHLPQRGQDVAASAFGLYRHWLRSGPGYGDLVRGYRERDRWSVDELASYQSEKLRILLGNAADHVPYYRQAWGHEEKRAARAGCLSALPLLAKEPVRSAPLDFARDDMRPLLRYRFLTSGSTGTPVSTLWTAREARDARALREVRSANWAGVSFTQGRATFSGRIVVPDANSNGPFHRYNRVEKQVYFSAFHLSGENADQYVEALWQHGTQWLTGYAMSYYLLARHILDRGLDVPVLKAVVTTSEKLTQTMRTVMEEAYRCPVFEEYGTVENAVFASACAHHRLHVSSDAGVVEILRPDGTPCAPGEAGEVVATGFVRQYQPFVRYRVGDVAAWDPEPCSCGRHLPVLKEVLGRIEDVVVGPDGRQMVRFHGIFVGQANIVEGQIIQEALDRIRVKIVPTAAFGTNDIADVEKRVRQRLGDVNVVVETVESIPRSASGKFQAVVSQMNG
ncbi:phenylacetate--CoA ligase family protein [Montanilutibacter psychrotolerans]|uniref:Phenylacetate--CoA ligase family protein n=1 Tax=Montanilutibacter psychrotolerans TaxID=1327343 RepID=A0A3M8SPL6_9GAMM|nr:phenylacetate--CoA ligase family protein [Lysobacter psychrotolerans]RNF83288.1 phenylacetate--CoA ligase family protein [Lysobacter psychrotolerans]